MGEEIKAQFYNSGVPATGLTPTITIRSADGVVVVDGEDMTEVADGRYTYQFADYNKGLAYYFRADGGDTLSDLDRYPGGVNFLDAYPNKNDWKGSGLTTVNMGKEESKKLAKSIRDEATKEHKKEGSFGELVQTLEKEETEDNKKQKEKEREEKKKMKEEKHKEIIKEIQINANSVKVENTKDTIKVLNSLDIIEKKEYIVDYDKIINTIGNKLDNIGQLIISTIPEEKEDKTEENNKKREKEKKELIDNIYLMLDNVQKTLEIAINDTNNKDKLVGIDKSLYYLTDTINNLK